MIIKDLSKIGWTTLKPEKRRTRILSLKVLDMMRDKISLTKASKEIEINRETVKLHIKSAIFKKHRRWFAKKMDNIERRMVINENGRRKSIIIKGSRRASLIGKYNAQVRIALKTGDFSKVRKFRKRAIRDIRDKKHKLETNPDNLYEIDEAMEDEEIQEIYREV